MSPAVTPDERGDPLSIASITVTHDPDGAILRRQQMQLAGAALRIVVDNASAGAAQAGLREIAAATGSELVALPANIGLAAAINVGLRHVRERHPSVQAILLLDQDTEPGATGLDQLERAYVALRREFGPEIALNPALVDADTGVDHGFHAIHGLRWIRVRRLDGDQAGRMRRAQLQRHAGGRGDLRPRRRHGRVVLPRHAGCGVVVPRRRERASGCWACRRRTSSTAWGSAACGSGCSAGA